MGSSPLSNTLGQISSLTRNTLASQSSNGMSREEATAWVLQNRSLAEPRPFVPLLDRPDASYGNIFLPGSKTPVEFLPNTPLGSPPVVNATNLSFRQAKTLLQAKLGAYDAYKNASPAQQFEMEVLTKMGTPKGQLDIANVTLGSFLDQIRNSPRYAAAKEYIKSRPDLTAKKLLQIGLAAQDPEEAGIALVLAQRKKSLSNTRVQTFNNIIKNMGNEDPAAEETRKKLEESNLNIIRNSMGGGE